MGAFNEIAWAGTCPRCQCSTEFQVEVKVGLKDQLNYRIGDQYQWVTGRSVQKGGRPDGGNIVAEGYTECPNCQKDFFVDVVIEQDTVCGAKVDPTREGYIE